MGRVLSHLRCKYFACVYAAVVVIFYIAKQRRSSMALIRL